MEFEYDQKNTLYVRIDRKRKFLGTIFLRALGLRTDEEILKTFYTVDTINVKDGKLHWTVTSEDKPTHLVGTRSTAAIHGGKGAHEEIVSSGKKIGASALKHIRAAGITSIEVETSEFEGAMTASDVVDMTTGELLYEANAELTADKLHKILQSGVTTFEVFFPERDDVGNIISNTLRRDSVRKPEEALIEIYRKLRPGDPPTLDTATALFEGMFFDPRKYDFSRVGRLKFNIKLYENQEATGLDKRTLTPEDFYGTIRYLLKLRKNIGLVDDIDHLGNRRVRAVGELMENQFRIGLVRMERAIKEKMSVYQEMSTAMPHDLINAKPVMAAIREFFGSSQLSQFMDQTNPLSEITHKRRLSALGPGGLSRERAGFEVRDVHPTHYGRICPIETPEGPNIGLISSLSCFARINEYGFIESPYRRVKDGKVLDYVAVSNAGESGLRQGDTLEINEAQKLNKQLKKDGKRTHRLRALQLLSLRVGGGPPHHRAGQHRPRCRTANITEDLVNARKQGNFVLVPEGRGRLHRRLARSSSSLSPPRSFRSSSTTTPTALSWARTCSASRFLCSSLRLRSSAPAWKASPRATPAPSSWPSATASWTRSTPNASSCASKASTTPRSSRVRSARTSTSSRSSSAPTRTPASTRSRSFARATAFSRGR